MISQPARTSPPLRNSMAPASRPSNLLSRENGIMDLPRLANSLHDTCQSDRCTERSISYDMHSPLPPSTPYSEDESTLFLDPDVDNAGNLCLQDKKSNPPGIQHYSHGDEQEESYEDEDASMELSDTDLAFPNSLETYQGDTIEDVINMSGTTVMPASEQDFSAFYPHDEPTPDETRELRHVRKLIEQELKDQVVEQAKQHTVTAEEAIAGGFTPEDNDLDNSDDIDVTCASQESFELYHLMRHASEPTSLHRTTPPPAIQTTFHSALQLPDTWSSPSAKSYIALPSNLPFSNGLNISPPFVRSRNTLSDHLDDASAAAKEKEELQELEQYRDMDLAPLEPVMQCEIAGDLITHGTPVKVRDAQIFGETEDCVVDWGNGEVRFSGFDKSDEEKSGETGSRKMSTSSTSIVLSDERDQDSEMHVVDMGVIGRTKKAAFITIIETLPRALFWCSVAAVARCSCYVFDMLVETLTGLQVEGKE